MNVVVALLLLAAICTGFPLPGAKSWWAKRVRSDSFYSAGRLSTSQIKYASEDGMKTIISLYHYDDSGNGTASTAQAREAAALSGIEYTTLLAPDADGHAWKTLSTLDDLGEKIRNSKQPVLLHCRNGIASTFLLLLHFARETITHGSNATVPAVTPLEIFRFGADMGYDYSKAKSLHQLVKTVTGYDVSNDILPTPQIALPKWYDHYWQAKPMIDNWFLAGSLFRDDVPAMWRAGFKTVVNVRKSNDSQEGVILLNIKNYVGGIERQTESVLLTNRIDPNKTNEYISKTSTVNYQSRNEENFGDDIGYNEYFERVAVSEYMEYLLQPMGGTIPYGERVWTTYKDDMLAVDAARTPVLVHCAVGMEAFLLAGMTHAYAEQQDSAYLLSLGERRGYDVSDYSPAAVQMFEAVLDNRAGTPPGGGAVSVGGCSYLTGFLFLAVTVIVVKA